jgi:hypothetical protein
MVANKTRRTYTSYELVEDVLCLSFQPNAPNAHRFRTTTDVPQNIGTGYYYGDEVDAVSVNGAASLAARSGIFQNGGWDDITLAFWAPSATQVPIAVDYILHIQAVPQNSSNQYAQQVTSNANLDINPSFSVESLIGMARESLNYARMVKRIFNGAADLYSSIGGKRYAQDRISRLETIQGVSESIY